MAVIYRRNPLQGVSEIYADYKEDDNLGVHWNIRS